MFEKIILKQINRRPQICCLLLRKNLSKLKVLPVKKKFGNILWLLSVATLMMGFII